MDEDDDDVVVEEHDVSVCGTREFGTRKFNSPQLTVCFALVDGQEICW